MKAYLLPLIFLLFGSLPSKGQQLNFLIASNFTAENQLVKIEIHSNYYPIQFRIGIVKGDNVHYNVFFAREGTHYYDLRTLDQWGGHIDYLATNLDQGFIKSYGLVESDVLKEVDVFLDKDAFNPTVVNFTRLRTFYTYPFTIILFILTVIIAIMVYFFKKNAVVAIIISVLLVTVIGDVRNIVNHYRAVTLVEKANLSVNPISFAESFAADARPLLEGGTWTYTNTIPDNYFTLYFKYKFADIPFIRNGATLPEKTFIISGTQPNGNQKMLLAKDEFYLHQQQ